MFSWEKIKALFNSRRFGLAVVGILVVVLQEGLGLTPDQAITVAGLIGAWIFGDTVRKTS